ncbi:helix-turn-helix domain-containing protein [Gluconobacter sp.]|uniref:helix-turn-helix domain-containing protein n=1 Tax=Gluconobacter sp. TaxID=1876758 RepID=UPI0039EA378F
MAGLLREADVEDISPRAIRQARLDAGLTQVSAASLVHVTPLTWKRWESGDRTMHPAFWELFALKVESGISGGMNRDESK